MLLISTVTPLAAVPSWILNTPSYALMVFGFGFVVFFHELGHFLAAKAVKIKVEQFAVGMGQAIVSWRRGLGFRFGSSRLEYEKRIQDHVGKQQRAELQLREKSGDVVVGGESERRAAEELKLGETEYRLNWLPLGGYVKMLGQDDLKAGAEVEDPRAYNNKSVGARMAVVSAGVIMNIILAMILFMALFLYGFNAPPAVAGPPAIGSPAQIAELETGDDTLSLAGHRIYTFVDLMLYGALLHEGEPAALNIARHKPDGSIEYKTLWVTPRKPIGKPLLALGIPASVELKAADDKTLEAQGYNKSDRYSDEMRQMHPGERIIAINGTPVNLDQFYVLDRALQASAGKPIEVSVVESPADETKGTPPATQSNAKARTIQVQPHFESFEETGAAFVDGPFNIAGMVPRLRITGLTEKSPSLGMIKPDDVLVEIHVAGASDAPIVNPEFKDVVAVVKQAVETKKPVEVAVLRGGETKRFTVGLEDKHLGLLFSAYDEMHPVVGRILPDSAASKAVMMGTGRAATSTAPSTMPAGIPEGALIEEIDGHRVNNWFDIRELLRNSAKSHTILARGTDGATGNYQLELSDADQTLLGQMRYTTVLPLQQLYRPRKTSSLLTAAEWGVVDTRDFILQFYLTLKRIVQGDVSPKNMMGPIGIFEAGASFAVKGNDWLIWFLAVISANLAVVNFLPIPIVDGGLFTFLIIEKIRGRPLSQRSQAIAQIAGLALIACVFLLVTYFDIARHFGPE